jgi:hypothetical protein
MLNSVTKYVAEFFYSMPRGQITKDIVKCEVLKLKTQLNQEWMNKSDIDPKWLAHQYLNKLLDKIEEYSR